ncbi:MAG: sarcosine oxidase subunit delta [Halofilum sp. (in: g-proteobacteria)]|nr:sarcosine oxidase subunit delta [Halofilum sp. (in: g-proteobacteria)]
MKLMNCPLNGWRNIGEFVYGGEVVPAPAHDAPTEEWADWVFMENNTAGVVREWWLHAPSSYWFIAERDTVRDQVLRSYPPDEVFTERVEHDKGAGTT